MNRCPSCASAVDASSQACPTCGSSLDLTSSLTVSMPPLASPPHGEHRHHSASGRPSVDQGQFLPGTLLAGRYRIISLLGRGGMGEVYRADDTKLGQPVALKFLPEAVARDADRLARFHGEARLGRQISHPNVCRLYDLVELEGLHCLTMEFVDGEDLSTLLKRIGRLPADKAVEIARDLCAGLAAAHDKGVIHRDLKPANVMIDGKGRARITDFGLAAPMEETGSDWLVGTPAYMAPEQLAGKPASVRSDLYALGLVLYETFTGKRRHSAKTLAELKALHAESRPPDLLREVKEIPPSVDKIIRQCLEPLPEARPSSALAVMAALPGGDPLQAAVAAGETPSPAMVVAAGKTGDLPVATAWGLLLTALAGMIFLAWITPRTTVIGRVKPDKSPEVLVEKARDILAKLGYPEPPADRAWDFEFDVGALRQIREQDHSVARRDTLDAVRPGPLLFYYRQSPRTLVAHRIVGDAAGPTDVGHVTRDDPPPDLPGMASLQLDPHGWLTGLRVNPRQESATATAIDPDWSLLLEAAGLDAANLKPAPTRRLAPMETDRKAAWEGVYPDQPAWPVHIEAAAFRGQPVWLDIHGSGARAEDAEPTASTRFSDWLIESFALVVGGVMLFMARRNLRLGRGDRQGAFRLAVYLFITMTLGLLLRADHVAAIADETSTLTSILEQAVFFSVLLWLEYMALEPIARRRWPELMIGWSRLLAGRVRDPRVGRDLIVGGLGGVLLVLCFHLAVIVPAWLGHPSRPPLATVTSTLASGRTLGWFLLGKQGLYIGFGWFNLFGIFFFGALLRNKWLGVAVQILLIWMVVGVSSYSEPWSLSAAAFTLIWFIVLLRAGVLASVVAHFFFHMLDATPLTLDFSAWYAGRTLLSLVFLAALLLCGFYFSLGGKPLFGRSLLEGDGER